MPIHDWTRVDAGLFHAFHQRWIIALADALNGGVLPADYFALPEQNINGPIPDVLALHLNTGSETRRDGGTAVAESPPQTRIVRRSEGSAYAAKADILTVRHRHGDVVAVIEIVSPGNKGSRAELAAFVKKSAGLLQRNVHLLVVDLFPPGPRDPQGIHQQIWDEFEEVEFAMPPGKPLTLAAYDAGPPPTAYVEPVAVGDTLPDMPLFLQSGSYIRTPLEATYATSWAAFPAAVKPLLNG